HGPQVVLADVTVVVPTGARIGLVGPNGVGKSTLLRVLAGIEEPDAGAVRRSPPDLRVGYLPQEPDARPDETLLSYLERRTGVGVFLLAEPTNDLGLDGLGRLERFVLGLPGAAVIVSHDREFLDRTVTRIVELDEGSHRAREFAGGWSEYEAERRRTRARHYERWDGYVVERARIREQERRMQQWEERGYGQGRKKKKSKDVKKAYARKLDRLEAVEKPYDAWEVRLLLNARGRRGEVVALIAGVAVLRGQMRYRSLAV